MKKADKPNIIIVLADDLGCCDLGTYGNTMAITPNIDRLAEQGIKLIHHYSASPMCAPARAGLLTGKHPHRTGAIDVPSIRGMNRVNPKENTLPKLLSSAGYATGLFGKWHSGGGNVAFAPKNYGYDEFCGFEGGVSPYFDYTIEREYGNLTQISGKYITDLITDEAIDFIDRHADEPFHIQIAYNAPHRPLEAKEEDIAAFEKYDCLTRGLKILYAMVKSMDENIGRVLDFLDKKGLSDNTLILFLSDNGPDFVGNGDMAISDRPFHDFRGHKGEVFDGGIRVPAIIRFPGLFDGGGVCNAPSVFMDWLPTLASVAGIAADEINSDIDGRDITAQLRGGELPSASYFWHWTRYEIINHSNMAVYRDGYKLCYPVYMHNQRYYKPDSPFTIMYGDYKIFTDKLEREHPHGDEKPMLFNLETDPEETHDLADEMPEKVKEMDAVLSAWHAEVVKDYEKAAAETLVNL